MGNKIWKYGLTAWIILFVVALILYGFDKATSAAPFNIFEGLVGIVIVMFLVLLGGIIYFLPTIIAGSNGHNNFAIIFLLNLFLGWSFIGWIIAVIWSVIVVGEKAKNNQLK
ncbi:MAG TPA: superinfection immunity protein [Pyrinomonadaceae bacterium]